MSLLRLQDRPQTNQRYVYLLETTQRSGRESWWTRWRGSSATQTKALAGRGGRKESLPQQQPVHLDHSDSHLPTLYPMLSVTSPMMVPRGGAEKADARGIICPRGCSGSTIAAKPPRRGATVQGLRRQMTVQHSLPVTLMPMQWT